jgi:hypothetical protein
LRGEARGPEAHVLLEPGVFASVEESAAFAGAKVWSWLSKAGDDEGFVLRADRNELSSLCVWLALRETAFFRLWTDRGDELAIARAFPFQMGDFRESFGLFDDESVALVVEIGGSYRVASFGAGGAAQRLVSQLRAWDASQRPSLDSYELRIYPRGRAPEPSADEHVIQKRWSTIIGARAYTLEGTRV